MAWHVSIQQTGNENGSFVYGFENNSPDADFVSLIQPMPDASIINGARALWGTYCAQLNMDVSGARCYLLLGAPNIGAGAVGLTPWSLAVSLDISLSALPTGTAGVITDSARGGNRYVEVQASGKLQVRNRAGLARGPLTPVALSTTTTRRLTIFWDALTLPTVWVSISLNGTEIAAFDTGDTFDQYWDRNHHLGVGEYFNAGYQVGCKMYVDNIVPFTSVVAGDMPHLTAFPNHKVTGGAAFTAEGNYTQWINTNQAPCGLAANKWTAISERPQNGLCTTCYTAADAAKQTFKTSAANPIPGGATVLFPVGRLVGALTGAGKGPVGMFVRLGGVDSAPAAAMGNLTTAFAGMQQVLFSRPGGGAWAQGDAAPNTLELGFATVGISPSAANITQMFSPEWIWYSDWLPFAVAPIGGSGAETPIDAPGGRGGAVLRPQYDHIEGRRANSFERRVREIGDGFQRSVRSRRGCRRAVRA